MSESDWKVVRTDEYPVLDPKDLEIQRLKAALVTIVERAINTDVSATDLASIAYETLHDEPDEGDLKQDVLSRAAHINIISCTHEWVDIAIGGSRCRLCDERKP